MQQSIWDMVGENFTQQLPRMTAVYVKERDENIAFAYPTGDNRSSYFFDFSTKTGYDLPAKFRFDFAVYEYPSIMNDLGANRALFSEQAYFPSMIRRNFEYVNLGIMGTERFGRRIDGAYTWKFDISCRNVWHSFHKKLYSVLSSDEPFQVSRSGRVLTLSFDDLSYHIAFQHLFQYAVYQEERVMKEDLKRQSLQTQNQNGYYMVVEHEFSLQPSESMEFVMGLSSESREKAEEALETEDYEERIRKVWNKWFCTLPVVGEMSRDEARVYYKCWWTIRNNYYNHPDWGFSIMEALPVYKGIWQWAVPSVEWHSEQNSEHTSEWIRKSIDMFLSHQRDDGYVTHAIYIDEKVPGEKWAKGGVIQTPHLPWVAVRYYRTTQDLDSLKRWFKPLCRYYDYLCESRDKSFFNWHLWAITSSFDTGLDTTSAFQRVTYGEQGIPKEHFCYPAVFAAERLRYELAMSQLASILGEENDVWLAEARKTEKAMQEHLWDDSKAWFGIVHEDGSLDTRVGVDGLFALAYGLVDERQAMLMERNLQSLIGTYGIRTVAEGEPGFHEDVYWRGASWPKSCSLGMAACCKYYPHLVRQVKESILRMCLAHPSIWECYNVRTGELAHSDYGFYCTPGVSSNVGASDIIGSLWLSHGLSMYDMDMVFPHAPILNFHWQGLWLSIQEKENRWMVCARAGEQKSGTVKVGKPNAYVPIRLNSGDCVVLP